MSLACPGWQLGCGGDLFGDLVSQVPHASSSSGEVWAPLRVVDEGLGDAGKPRQWPGAGAAQPAVVQAPVEDRGNIACGVDLSNGGRLVKLVDRV